MFMHPVPGPITSPYGWRRVGLRPQFHNGVDYGWLLADPTGSQIIRAPHAGRIDRGFNSSVGNYIGITVRPGLRIRLCHLRTFAVDANATVNMGDPVGIMGQTGNSRGIHLHLEVWVDGARVDPKPYFTIPFKPDPTDPEPMELDVKLIRRTGSATLEWSLFHPTLRGPSELERGYITTTDPTIARGWARTWADGFGSEKSEPRDVYVEMQAAARITYTPTPATVDVPAIAKAVNDDTARRLAS